MTALLAARIFFPDENGFCEASSQAKPRMCAADLSFSPSRFYFLAPDIPPNLRQRETTALANVMITLARPLPRHCHAAPTSDSDVKVEIWMTVAGWQGKFGPGSGEFAPKHNGLAAWSPPGRKTYDGAIRSN